MARKYELITELYAQTIREVTKSPESWRIFLRTACYNYRLRFDEQVLLFAQRPDATAVLEIERWNRKFGRWVNRGATGIAVFDDTHNGLRLKYYFDIGDTYESRMARPVPLWEVKLEYEAEVIESLENSFGDLAEKEDLAGALLSAAKNAVEDNMPDYLSELRNCTEGSFLEELDDFNIESAYRRALENSVGYMLLSRCGLPAEEYFTDDDFRGVLDFNSRMTVNALGVATSGIAQMCLAEISRTVRNLQKLGKNQNRTFEKEPQNRYPVSVEKEISSERGFEYESDIRNAGRLQSAESDRAPGAGSGHWEIRIAAPQIPERESAGAVHEPADGGQAERPSDGSRTDGALPAGSDGERNGEGRGRDGEPESDRSDALGGADEQHPSFGGGSGAPGAGLQLKPLPTVAEQQEILEEAEAEKAPAFSVSQEDIDAVLQHGSSSSNGKYRIFFYFQQEHTLKDAAAFLKKEYGIGGGSSFGYPDGTWGSWSYDGKGVQLEKYGSYTEPDLILRWKKVAVRLKELIDAGRYLNGKEQEEIPLYLERVAAQELQSEKQKFIDSVAELPPAEKRDSLPQRLTDFVRYLDGYERDILDEYDLSELKENSLEKVQAYLQSPEKVTQLFAFLNAVKGRTCSVFSRSNAWSFGLELKELFPWRYEYHLGDSVYLGAEEYEILDIGDETVRLCDANFPLFNKEFSREEFDRRLAESPSNEHLLAISAYQPAPPLDQEAAHAENTAGPEPAEESPNYDLMYGHLGNGVTVWNRLAEEDGDYKTVAHISPERQVTFYDDALPQALREEIEHFARTSDMRISATQDAPVFSTPSEKDSHVDEMLAQAEQIAAESAVEPYERFTLIDSDGDFDDPYVVWDDLHDGYYVDEDSVTPTFDSRWQGEAYVEQLNKETADREAAEWRKVEKAKLPPLEYAAGDHFTIFAESGSSEFVLTEITEDEVFYAFPDLPEQEPAASSREEFDRNLRSGHIREKQPDGPELIGRKLTVEDRDFVVESINGQNAMLRDLTFEGAVGFPISREMPLDAVKEKLAEREREAAAGNQSEYRLLDRLRSDCDYYLGQGGRAEKHLWAGDVEKQIAKMRELYRQLPVKPEWLTEQDIDDYERRMTGEPAKEAAPATPALDTEQELRRKLEGVKDCRGHAALLEDAERLLRDKNGDSLVGIASDTWLRQLVGMTPDELHEYAETYQAGMLDAYALLPDAQPAPPPPPENRRRTGRIQTYDLHPEIPLSDRHQFSITDDELGYGGPREKFRANLDAIHVLQTCEQENRYATPAEQELLSRYVGWGSLPQVFEENNTAWANEYLELKAALSPEEYASARESTLTAFYTPPAVIRAVYQTLSQMGFSTGNILEPSCGTGHFFGMLPDEMKASKIYGVELDSLTGRIAQQLYQKSNIAVQGFENTNLPDSFFDVVLGNVPFGQFKVLDKKYDKLNFFIHDYFFAKTIDKLRPGGVMAFITSNTISGGTFDKKDNRTRKYIAQRCDLLGAIRLPNDTFLKSAGTDVNTDILFFQKRPAERDLSVDMPEWVDAVLLHEQDYVSASGEKRHNYVTMNPYYQEHPEMVLGEQEIVTGAFGPQLVCKPYENADLGALLQEAIVNIHAEIRPAELDDLADEDEDNSILADPAVRNFSYAVVDGALYFRENSRMFPVEASVTAENRIKGMIALRDQVRDLIEFQTEDYSDFAIQEQQKKLNRQYDSFNQKYGRINSRANSSVFSSDSSYCLLCSLEVLDDDGNFLRKADMFTKRTIRRREIVTSVDTASEALALSLGEKARVDLPYMVQLTGKGQDEIAAELQGVIFQVPGLEEEGRPVYQTADEYLSGNVREKLRAAKLAAEGASEYAVNVSALETVQPQDLSASEISVRLGATWLPPEIIEQFMFHLFSTPKYKSWNIKVHYSQITGAWSIEGKSIDKDNLKACNTYGSQRIHGYKILEETLNLKDVRVFDYFEDAEGKRQAVLNKKETAIAQGKQELIKQAFADWIWADPERRQRLCLLYNEKFNSLRPREYDGSHLRLVGMNPEITLRQHQLNAVARVLYGGNTLLAHVVGAGKTFEMVAAAQESKRLGLCQKSLFVVPNHLLEQWASDYLQLYPSANILVANKKSFETKNRKKFCARIATGDYDAIIIGHSQFEKIPMSVAFQRAALEQEMEEILDGISELKAMKGDRFSIKQLEKTRKSLKAKLEKLNDQSRKDDVVTFEELGVDRLYVDEAHYYKNLYLYTKMRNVGGISQTEAQKSSDLFMKCRYLGELTGGKGIIFATGTPVSNSMVELYTMQRYLQMNLLQRNQLQHFDAWASTFGETVTAIELAPEGTGYRVKTRFARFYNLPELMMFFREIADIQTADMLHLPVPKANYHTVALKPSEQQKEMVAALSDRAERVRNRMVDSREDNMLLITNDGRKLALDQRLLNPLLPDSDTSKSSACAEKVYEIWERTKEQRSTQAVFCDLSTPNGKKPGETEQGEDDVHEISGQFSNIYEDIRQKLIDKGIPADEIAFIHEAKTDVQKKELFGRVRSGKVRVIFGSTQMMGAGTNIQNRLIALHHLDCPWRPADLQQREGRIIRQGNDNPEVEIYSYVTEQTFDAYLYQLVESKQKFIGQIMTSKSPVRSAEDVDETALSYAEIKALASGNPHIKEKMDLDIAVSRLKLLKANHLSQKYALEDQILKYLPQKIRGAEERIRGLRADQVYLAENTKPNADGFSPMVVEGTAFTEKKAAGSAILAACQAMKSPDAVPLGEYRGFSMVLYFESFSKEYRVTLKHELSYTVSLGADVYGNIQRIDNALDGLVAKIADSEQQLEGIRGQLAGAKSEVEKPFPQEEELKEKSARLDELNILLNMDKRENEMDDGDRSEDEGDDDRKPQRDYER